MICDNSLIDSEYQLQDSHGLPSVTHSNQIWISAKASPFIQFSFCNYCKRVKTDTQPWRYPRRCEARQCLTAQASRRLPTLGYHVSRILLVWTSEAPLALGIRHIRMWILVTVHGKRRCTTIVKSGN